jgi:Xaa-Pro aminopeptidase
MILQLLNRTRASEILRRTGLEAFVITHPLNVYYATAKIPVLDRMSTTHQALAVIPADETRPVCYIGSAFEYYYNASDAGVADGVVVHLVSPAAADPLRGAEGAMMRVLDAVPLDAREMRRRRSTAAAQFHGDADSGLTAIFRALGIGSGAVGIDSLEAQQRVAAAAPEVSTRPAADLLRHVRLVKMPDEVKLMRIAAEANARALVAAAESTRDAPSLIDLRARFFAEAARRGNTPIFMLVDGVMDESIDEPLVAGRAFLLDAVSHRGFYQGDYARTVCIGEPSPEMSRVAAALDVAWAEIRASLRPGLRFSQIKSIGTETLKRLGYDYTVAFKPHAVGLTHEDQPIRDLDGGPLDLALVEGMILSVDCPLLDVGVGGSAHLEDLTLITATGGETIHSVDPTLIRV